MEQSKIKKVVYDTCQSLGWDVTFGEDDKVLANITRSDIDLYVSISCQDDGTCTINPVKISCAPSDEQRARRLFRRFIKNLKKYILRNTSAMSQKQSGSTKAITVIGGKKAITLSSQTITGKDTSGKKEKSLSISCPLREWFHFPSF